MTDYGVTLSLIGVMFVSIIGVYVIAIKILWSTNEQLSRVYETINNHIQDAKSHTNSDELVNQQVCNKVQNDFNNQISSMEKKIDGIATDVKTLIKGNN